MTEAIVSHLKSALPTLSSVFLFGRMAPHQNTANSDVDIAIVTKRLYTTDADTSLAQEVYWLSEYLDFNEMRHGLVADIQRRGTIYE